MSSPYPDSGTGARTPRRGRGWAIFAFALLGLVLGLVAGALVGLGLGLLWAQSGPPAREDGLAIVFLFMPFGAIVGALLGAILLGRRAARRGRPDARG